MVGLPPISFPIASESFDGVFSNFSDSSNSRKDTTSRSELGSSIPIAFRPCTTATRAEIALIDRAISSARPMTLDDLIPGAGSNS